MCARARRRRRSVTPSIRYVLHRGFERAAFERNAECEPVGLEELVESCEHTRFYVTAKSLRPGANLDADVQRRIPGASPLRSYPAIR
jgi:hypothetical protein